ncbi:hypothetical protein BH11PSE13_BH11PSE13_38010 [soil metagenome]
MTPALFRLRVDRVEYGTFVWGITEVAVFDSRDRASLLSERRGECRVWQH